MQLFIFGDSITWGAWDSEGGWADRIKKQILAKNIESQFEITTEVYNLGISGDTSFDLLHRLESDVLNRKDETESIIIIAIGINDTQYYEIEKKNEISRADFIQNCEQLYNKARQFTRKIVFVGITPVDESLVSPMPWKVESSYRNSDIKNYNESLKKFCTDCNARFIDMEKEYEKTDYTKLLADGVHPNSEGHELMYKLVWEKLQPLLSK